jgi:hypothetical protein
MIPSPFTRLKKCGATKKRLGTPLKKVDSAGDLQTCIPPSGCGSRYVVDYFEKRHINMIESI